MTSNLTGSTALVTGGTSGIGRAAALATELGGGHVDILVNNAGVFPFGATRIGV
jgi:NAD(P)-dependent dehydrogenase (short-subunit alcohol dehydrogenase family)